ncbi:MAG: hypothetical protein QOG35_1159 [Solirubrobacteraceae bacterium]|jgi:hypothetical protein|nr:hypothetical protein [Solirubrobacteraceae bacterium]
MPLLGLAAIVVAYGTLAAAFAARARAERRRWRAVADAARRAPAPAPAAHEPGEPPRLLELV